MAAARGLAWGVFEVTSRFDRAGSGWLLPEALHLSWVELMGFYIVSMRPQGGARVVWV